MTGYIRIQRGLFDHDAFRSSQPLTEFEVWIWLIEHANYAPQRFRSGYTIFEVPRGSLATHYRSLAKQWRWDHKRAIRFLKMLQSESMIVLQTTHRMVQITLCNYDKYQRPWDSDDAAEPQPRPKKAPRMGTKRIQVIQEIQESKDPPTPLPDWLPIPEWESFKEFRQRINSPMTEKAEQIAIRELDKLKNEGHDPKAVIEQSIMNNWKGLFKLKGEKHGNTGTSNGTSRGNGHKVGAAEIIGSNYQPPSKWQIAGQRVLDKIDRGEI